MCDAWHIPDRYDYDDDDNDTDVERNHDAPIAKMPIYLTRANKVTWTENYY